MDLQKLLNQRRKRETSDFNIAELPDIYLGISAYMIQDGMRPVKNLYDMTAGLKFKNISHMLEAVKNCGTFILLKADNPYGLLGFYSPLRHHGEKEDLLKKETENLSKNQKGDTIYIIPSGNPFG